MKNVALLSLLFLVPLASAYTFNFSSDVYTLIRDPTFAWADVGNTTFEWRGYELNTTEYLYWAGILLSGIGNCTLSSDIRLRDKKGEYFHMSYGTSGRMDGVSYLQIFTPDLYSHHHDLDRGPYILDISLKVRECEVTIKEFTFITSKIKPNELPLLLTPPSSCPTKEPKVSALEFANKTYWREFELNFTFLYDGSDIDLVNGWKSEPCPILNIYNGKVCLAEDYCTSYCSANISPGIYNAKLKLQGSNLFVKLSKNGIAFEKTVQVRHPLYLASLGAPCSHACIYNVTFYGVEGDPSETFYTKEEMYGGFILAIAVLIALIIGIKMRK